MIQSPRKRRCAGNALIETALVLMLLLLLTFAGMEYGWMFMRLQEVTNAARQGARVGATVDGSTADVNASVDAAMTAAGMDKDKTNYTVTTSPTEVGSATALDSISVTVSVDYVNNLDLLKMPLLGLALPAKLKAKITMVKEGLQ